MRSDLRGRKGQIQCGTAEELRTDNPQLQAASRAVRSPPEGGCLAIPPAMPRRSSIQSWYGPDGVARDVLERPYAAGGGVRPPGPPPPLPMFEADSQNFASVPSVPRGFTLQILRRAFGGDHRGTLGGGGVPANPPPPQPNPMPVTRGYMRVLYPLLYPPPPPPLLTHPSSSRHSARNATEALH